LKFTFTIGFIIIYAAVTAQKKIITVAQDGSGNYKTVQYALDAIPLHNKKPVTIFIRNGIYREKLHLDSTKDFVTISGEDKFNTVISWDDHTGKLSPNGDTINTYSSETFLIKADHFKANNLTFDNHAGFTAGQAVAVQASGDQLVFSNCRFTGNQDVLFMPPSDSRQYYTHCYIEGTTDFIFGAATAWFEQCHIHSKKNSHITAASTPAGKLYGFVFNDCVLTGDTTLHTVSLGRPWRPYAAVVYIHCYIGPHIKPEGWSNWNNTDNYKTARYAEYKNYGPGADITHRLSWSTQLSEADVKKYTVKQVFKNWLPD
jgi:pectinesterase